MIHINKKKKNIVILFLIVIVAVFIVCVYQKQDKALTIQNQEIENTKTEPSKTIQKTNNATLQIDGVNYGDEIEGKVSVYDFMDKMQNEGRINFTDENYLGMGKLITSINNIQNSGRKNWIYYVNGVEAQVGVSNYKINKGDVVSWKYEKANY